MPRWAVLAWAIAGCTAGDIDTDDPFDDPPDITGEYDVTLSEPEENDCNDPDALLRSWLEGSMSVQGDPEALAFDFGDGYALDGSVSADLGFEMAGDVEASGRTVSVYAPGIAISESSNGETSWRLEGDVDAVVDPGTSDECTMVAPFEAVQVTP